MGRRTGQHTTLPFFPARTHTLLASLLDRLSASPRLVVQSLKGVSGDIIVLEEVRRRGEHAVPTCPSLAFSCSSRRFFLVCR